MEIPIVPAIVGTYFGLKDKNGDPLRVGDTIRVTLPDGRTITEGKIVFDPYTYGYAVEGGCLFYDLSYSDVIFEKL